MKNCSVRMNPKAFVAYEDSPGPAAYGHKTTVGQRNRMPNISNEPAYSVKQRLDKDGESPSPGPVYNIESLTCRGQSIAPKFSMGMKLAKKSDYENPGPAAYLPKPDERRPKLKILLPLKDLDSKKDEPGPNVYMLPSTLSHKGITLAKKFDFEQGPDSPGPIYQTVSLNKYKHKAPKISLAKKLRDPQAPDQFGESVPSPLAYSPTLDNTSKYKRVPKFSFGVRRPNKFPPMVVCGDEVIRKRN